MKVIDKLACPTNYNCRDCVYFKRGWFCDKSQPKSYHSHSFHSYHMDYNRCFKSLQRIDNVGMFILCDGYKPT